jgi:hypothetical protein
MRQSRKTVRPSRDRPFWVDKLIGNLRFKFHADAAQECKQFTRTKDTNPEQSRALRSVPAKRDWIIGNLPTRRPSGALVNERTVPVFPSVFPHTE